AADRLAARGPLAARMRPRTLDEVVGQRHLVAPGAPLRALVEKDRLASAISRVSAKAFVPLSAVNAGVADVRKAVEEAKARLGEQGQGTILFIDEVHRFNKAQQDALLPSVEDGLIVLIGATTENPFFSVNSPLLSRSTLWRLEALTDEDLGLVVHRALEGEGATATEEAVDALVSGAGGAARFIPRRLVILASEDVGLADPLALVVADAAARAVEFVGLPEAQLNLAQAVVYLAAAPKSNRVTVALGRAQEDVRTGPRGEVPAHLRDAHYAGAQALGHGRGYRYPHDDPR